MKKLLVRWLARIVPLFVPLQGLFAATWAGFICLSVVLGALSQGESSDAVGVADARFARHLLRQHGSAKP